MAMPGKPSIGDRAIYEPGHGKGYGSNARGSELTAEMTALDLNPGTEVVVYGLDAHPPNWPIIQWTDSTGISRLTTMDQGQWNSDFNPVP